jgi:hypothetical protein
MALTQRATVVSGDGAADGRIRKGGAERQPLPVPRKLATYRSQSCASLDCRGEVAVLMGKDAGQSARADDQIHGGRPASPTRFRAFATDDRGETFLGGPGEQGSQGLWGIRLDDEARLDVLDPVLLAGGARSGATNKAGGFKEGIGRHQVFDC